MRIAFRHSLRIQTLARTRSTRSPPSRCWSLRSYNQYRRIDDTATSSPAWPAISRRSLSNRHGKDSQDILRPPHRQRYDPTAWIALLDRYIPFDLGGQASKPNIAPANGLATVCVGILDILNRAKKNANVGSDILAYMIVHSRRKAALWICDALLKNLSSRFDRRPVKLPPSNVLWPAGSLDQITSKSIACHALAYTSTESCDEWETQQPDPRYSFDLVDVKDKTMDQIWHTLGVVVAQSADMAELEAQQAMNAVQLVLGQIHNLDLVPENVYDYRLTPFTTAVQRPPIVHLVSSRILTALSDAAWREHQDGVIEKAASHGVPYEEIGRDPPGGRFRLKVSPMGPQIWLEFILWCCVEGGFVTTGSRIINYLRQNLQDPWFAVAWSTRRGTAFTLPQIDWERVKSRSGGTVGRIEGYSRERPLAEVPPKTISTEVLLALAESHIDLVRRHDDGQGVLQTLVQNNIAELVAFLEPHDLPLSYFDYVAARLLMTDTFDGKQRASRLQAWTERLSFLKTLKSIQEARLPRVSLAIEDLPAHSEFGAGLMHQVLDAYVLEGNVHEALITFDGLQRLVDNSKLHAISAFLQNPDTRYNSFFSSRPFGADLDFIRSHGQLPLYRVAGLLNLATEAKLIGFGQWLLYNDDPDGPLIPKSAYKRSSIARPLVRFAGMSGDGGLLRAISPLPSFSQRLPSVNFLRARFDACVLLQDFPGATEAMKQLRRAEGGGFGLTNLVHLASAILKLESDAPHKVSTEIDRQLGQATFLFDSMLSSQSNGRHGVLQRSVRAVFRQQIGHLLRVIVSVSDSSLASMAVAYLNKYPASNVPNLSPTIFNVFLDAVMQTQGASRGVEMVTTFCTDGSKQDWVASPALPEDHVDSEEDTSDTWEAPTLTPTRRNVKSISAAPNPTSQSFIPFVTDREAGSLQKEQVSQDASEETTTQNGRTDAPISDLAEAATASDDFSSPFFAEVQGRPTPGGEGLTEPPTSADSVPDPVCVMNPRTIQLIARTAVREKRQYELDGLSVDRQDGILTWAKGSFVRHGYPQFMIRNEINETLPNAYITDVRDREGARSPQGLKRQFRPNKSSRVSGAFESKRKAGSKNSAVQASRQSKYVWKSYMNEQRQ